MSFGTSALLITGASGAGKSTLALQLIALGAVLVADDRVIATPRDSGVWLTAPDTLRGQIEARGVGILHSRNAPAWATAVLDLDQTETARLPETREIVIAGHALPLLRKVEGAAFPAMLKLYLLGGTTGHDSGQD